MCANERSLPCYVCGIAFITTSSLTRGNMHPIGEHEVKDLKARGEVKNQCSHCGKGFAKQRYILYSQAYSRSTWQCKGFKGGIKQKGTSLTVSSAAEDLLGNNSAQESQVHQRKIMCKNYQKQFLPTELCQRFEELHPGKLEKQ